MSERAPRRARRGPRAGVFASALVAGAVAASLVLAGCASRAPSDHSRAPSAPGAVAVALTGTDAGPAPTGAGGAVLAAYGGYIRAETLASQSADYGSPDLSKYMGDPLLGQWIAQLFHLHVVGDVQKGAVISHPKLQSLSVTKKSGKAVVRDCLDQSGISLVKAATGEAVPMPVVKPYVAVATLYRYPNGAWRVSSVDTPDGATC